MISVIVPFYKDFPYLRQAVHSVLAQGLKDFEIVIVNDNPTPEAIRFLEAQAFPEPVTIVHHEVNRGLSAARNTGVKHSRGAYIVYLDADDYFIPGGLRAQLERAEATGADVTHATTLLRHDQGVGNQRDLNLVARDAQLFSQDLDATTVEQTPELQFIISSWKSIYRRDFLDRSGIVFDEAQRKFEDRLYVLETVFSGATFTLCKAPARIWRRRPGSITTSTKSDGDMRMMVDLVDKCTALLGRKVASGGYDTAFLEREVFHSLSRLFWDTPLLARAAEADETAQYIRDVLTGALSRADLTEAIFDDVIVRKIDRVGLATPSGVTTSREQFLTSWNLIRRNDWASLIAAETKAQAALAARAESKRRPIVDKRAGEARFGNVELVIHLGMHKTGTTHLQREFHRNREAMRAAGVLFPLTGFSDAAAFAAKADATPGHQEILRAILDKDTQVLQALEEEVAASGCARVLISCENMSFPYQPGAERRRRVAEADRFFANFPNRRVVSVIRRPDAYFEALYRERVGNAIVPETRSASEFMASHMNNVLDLANILEPWEEFAGGALTLLNYEELKTAPNYAHAFTEALGLGLGAVFPNEGKTNARTYSSASWDEIELIRLLNLTVSNETWRKAAAQSFINTCTALGRDKGQSLLSPDERIGLVNEMRASSEAFFAARGFAFDFDGFVADLEAEIGQWRAPETLSFDRLEAFINAAVATQALAKKGWGLNGSGGASGEDGGRRGLLAGLFEGHSRQRLLKVYGHLPAWGQRLARHAYGRLR